MPVLELKKLIISFFFIYFLLDTWNYNCKRLTKSRNSFANYLITTIIALMMNDKKILIFGGSGLLGSQLVKTFPSDIVLSPTHKEIDLINKQIRLRSRVNLNFYKSLFPI